MLHPHAAVAALAVQHTAIKPLLLSRLENTIDIRDFRSADKQWYSTRVVEGDGYRLVGRTLCALRKNRSKSEKAICERVKDRGQQGS